MSQRILRVNQLLKKEISKIIQTDLKQNVGMVSILRVSVSRDLHYAKVYYSVLGNSKDKERVSSILENNRIYIKMILAKRVRLKFLPDLKFILDDSIEHSFHMEEVFERLDAQRHKEDNRK